MKVTILGSGTILSELNRNPSAYLVQKNKSSFLLDCGPGTLHQLNVLKHSVSDLECVFLSHFHLDHCSDMFALLMRRYLLDNQSNETFKIFGPSGLADWFEALASTQGSWLSGHRPEIVELSGQVMFWQGVQVSVCRNGHTENSISYLFTNGNKKFFYSSDMDYNPALVKFASHSDVAIVECSYPDEQAHPGHLTPLKLAQIVNLAKIKKTIVTHIYPENDTNDLAQRIKIHSTADIEIGFDLMQINIRG